VRQHVKLIIEDARRSGKPSEGQRIVEMTSRNLGAGLASLLGDTGSKYQ